MILPLLHVSLSVTMDDLHEMLQSKVMKNYITETTDAANSCKVR